MPPAGAPSRFLKLAYMQKFPSRELGLPIYVKISRRRSPFHWAQNTLRFSRTTDLPRASDGRVMAGAKSSRRGFYDIMAVQAMPADCRFSLIFLMLRCARHLLFVLPPAHPEKVIAAILIYSSPLPRAYELQ